MKYDDAIDILKAHFESIQLLLPEEINKCCANWLEGVKTGEVADEELIEFVWKLEAFYQFRDCKITKSSQQIFH